MREGDAAKMGRRGGSGGGGERKTRDVKKVEIAKERGWTRKERRRGGKEQKWSSGVILKRKNKAGRQGAMRDGPYFRVLLMSRSTDAVFGLNLTLNRSLASLMWSCRRDVFARERQETRHVCQVCCALEFNVCRSRSLARKARIETRQLKGMRSIGNGGSRLRRGLAGRG